MGLGKTEGKVVDWSVNGFCRGGWVGRNQSDSLPGIEVVFV